MAKNEATELLFALYNSNLLHLAGLLALEFHHKARPRHFKS